MDTLIRDVRHALRLLAGHRGFAAAALITIAIGVGGSAAVFSVVYGVLLRPLPYAEPDRLVRLSELHPGARATFGGANLTAPTYRAWSRAHASLQDLAAFGAGDYTITTPGAAAQRVRGTRVTPSVFRVLRVSPIAGRFFNDEDAAPGAPPAIVLAYATWRERFGADPSAIGRTIEVDEVERRIVGVAPAGFAFPEYEGGLADAPRDLAFYLPFAVPEAEPGARVVRLTQAIARLTTGVTPAQAEAEGTSFARSVDRPSAELIFGKGGAVEVRAVPMADHLTRSVRPALMVLAAGVGLVLLIACANVANLFLSRGADRARELAVRATLGAGRRRLLRQLLTESLVISLIGGGLGLLVGWALTTAVPALAPAGFPRLRDIRVDGWFLAAAALSAIGVGAISGILPALRGSRIDLAAAMQTGGRTIGASGARLRRTLLIVEAALAVVLLVGATLLARSFVALVHVDAGYDPAGVLTATLRLPRSAETGVGGQTGGRGAQIIADAIERLRAMPGVRAAGAGNMTPFGDVLSSAGFALPGVTTPDGQPVVAQALHAVVTPGYAEALGMRLKEGRFFRSEDTTAAIHPLLVNDTFARTYLADGRPVTGRRFTGIFPRMLKRTDAVFEIIGVVQDVLPDDLAARPHPQVYVSIGSGFDMGGGATLVVKTDADPAPIATALRGILRQIEPAATLDRMGPLADKVSASVGEPRFAALVLLAFAGLALALATTGLYGVLSYHVARQRREIGVRAALGATRADLLRLVLREGLGTTAIGLVVGVAAAAALTRAMSSLLFGVTALDTVAFSVGPLVLLVVACAACLIPARRAAAIDPTEALRAD
jgi:predicted permease